MGPFSSKFLISDPSVSLFGISPLCFSSLPASLLILALRDLSKKKCLHFDTISNCSSTLRHFTAHAYKLPSHSLTTSILTHRESRFENGNDITYLLRWSWRSAPSGGKRCAPTLAGSGRPQPAETRWYRRQCRSYVFLS